MRIFALAEILKGKEGEKKREKEGRGRGGGAGRERESRGERDRERKRAERKREINFGKGVVFSKPQICLACFISDSHWL